MKLRLAAAATALLFSGISAIHAEVETYEIDPAHSGVHFSVRHFFSDVPGRFNEFTGAIKLDSDKPEESSVAVTIQATSIDTGNEKRDAHLRGADFFDVEKFPVITFKSTKVERTGEDAAKVTGDFTLHGVTRPVTLDVTLLGKGKGTEGEKKTGWSATTKISRKEFGIDWGKVVEGTAMVGDEVTIKIDAEANAK